MLGKSPTKTQELLGNPDKSANPTASSPACAGLAGEHCTSGKRTIKITFHRTYENSNEFNGELSRDEVQLSPLEVGCLKYMAAYRGETNFQQLWNEKCIYTL